jgi:integrase
MPGSPTVYPSETNMPRLSSRVLSTARDVQTVKSDGRHAEYRIKGMRNLILRVAPGGTMAWSFVFRSPATGKRRKISLGNVPSIDLDRAKDLALAHTLTVRSGKEPCVRVESKPMTFKELVDVFLSEHEMRSARGRTGSWPKELRRILKSDILPTLGLVPASSVTRVDVAKVVDRVVARGSFVAADRVLGIVRSIFSWANGTGKVDIDPARGLKKRNTGRPRERVLSDIEIRTLWRALDGLAITDQTMCPAIRDALRLQLLLGVRIGEAVGAARIEFDLERAVWTIPAGRTKSGREHRLPLSPMATGIIAAAMERAGRSPWLFPSSVDGKPIRPKSASRALMRLRRRLGVKGVGTHDLRRTVATGLGDMGVADEIIERVLNHAPATVTRKHYNRAERFEEMRAALERWAEKLDWIIAARGTREGRAAEPTWPGGLLATL